MQKTIYFSAGDFIGPQAYFDRLKGVDRTTAGYVNGDKAFPKYKDVIEGRSSAAFAVKVDYDDSFITLKKLIEHYLRFVDPYSFEKQGNQAGHCYRSGIYYVDPLDGMEAEVELHNSLKPGYAIKVEFLENFFPAESYYQHYLDQHPGTQSWVDLKLIYPFEKKTK